MQNYYSRANGKPYHNMRFTPYYILYTLLAFLTLPMSVQAEVQSSDSSATRHFVHQLMFDYRPGAILHTNDFLRGKNPEVRTMNHDMGYYLKYAFSAPEDSEQASIYRDAYQGVGIGWNEFNPQLGNPVSVFILQGARIASLSDRLSFNYEWNLGLTFGWNPYDAESNPDNKLIGSRVTAYIGLDMYMRWIASRHVDINLGFNVTHYSNGNTQFPNLGLNTVALRIGAPITSTVTRRACSIATRTCHRCATTLPTTSSYTAPGISGDSTTTTATHTYFPRSLPWLDSTSIRCTASTTGSRRASRSTAPTTAAPTSS